MSNRSLRVFAVAVGLLIVSIPLSAHHANAVFDNGKRITMKGTPSALTNDPMPGCDPQGFPRIVLHNAHHQEMIQTPAHVVILYQFNKKWRAIWTDGRELPKDPDLPGWTIKGAPPPEPRWWVIAT